MMDEDKYQGPALLGFVLRVVGLTLFGYMAYATLYGPYKTTVVHLALFAAAMLFIAFLGRGRSEVPGMRAVQWGLDVVAAVAAVGS